MARRKTELAETMIDDVVEGTIAGEEMARESGITRELPRTKKVTWSGPGRIGIAGYGDLQPEQSISLPSSIADDLAHAPGFSIET